MKARDAGFLSITGFSLHAAFLALALLAALPTRAQTNLIDVQFCALDDPGNLSARKTGLAAIGQTTDDFWNAYSRDNGSGGFLTFGSLANLLLVNGDPTAAGLTVANAPGAWSNGSADPMYATYLYPFDGGDIVLTVTNLNAGTYDFYLYGHGDGNNQNSTYQLSVAGQSYGSLTTLDAPGWQSLVWQDFVQYVAFSNVVVSAGQSVVITVLPGDSGYAILSGLQMAQVAAAAPSAPTITTQPAGTNVPAGGSATFSVCATGSFPLSYQWSFNSNPLPGATSPTLVLNDVQPTNAGDYSVTVTNVAGSAVSSNAVLSVFTPTNLAVGSLIDVQFCALANPGTLSARKTGLAAIGDNTNDFWNAYSRDDGQGGFLNFGSLSNLLEVDSTPTTAGLAITNAPGAWSNGTSDPMYSTYLYPFNGGDIVLTLTNLSAGSYDFYLYGHALGDNGNSTYQLSVAGQSYGSQTTLDAPGWDSIAWQDFVQYVLFSNVVVATGQPVLVTVLPGDSGYAVLSGLQIAAVPPVAPAAPVITSQPTNSTVIVGGSASFAVGVTGSYPLSYQWSFDSNAIVGATASTLTLNNVQLTNAGAYSVTISNLAGVAYSSNAVLTVNPPGNVPAAAAQSVSLIENTSVAITLTGSGGDGNPLTYSVVAQPTNGTLVGTPPDVTYEPDTNYSGPDSFTFQVTDGATTSPAATVSLVVLPESSGPLIDVQFGQNITPRKTGFAATGQTTNDFWNFYTRDGGSGTNTVWLTNGSLANLEFVNDIPSGAGLLITNAPGAWGNGSADAMYGSYIYPFDGGDITLAVTNLPAGTYSVWIYGHAPGNDGNSTYQLSVDSQSYGSETTAGPGWASPVWQNGVQYVLFGNVAINSGQALNLVVLPGASGYAVLSGLQIEQTVPPAEAQTSALRSAPAQSLLFSGSSTSAASGKLMVATPPPMLTIARSASKQAGVTFDGEIGRSYRIDARDNPNSGSWTPVAIITVTKSPFTYSDPDSATRPQRFYRVVALPQ